MRCQPIENHGIVGNRHSAALVSLDPSAPLAATSTQWAGAL
jgi:hypothetical protein